MLRASLYLNALLAIALIFVGGLWQYQKARTNHYAAAYAKAEAKAQLEARAAEQRHAQDLAAIADKYEKDKRAADEAQRKLVSDLRAGTVRLRKEWRVCEAGASATASELDAATRAREALAAAIVREGRDADDTQRALQEVVRKDRER